MSSHQPGPTDPPDPPSTEALDAEDALVHDWHQIRTSVSRIQHRLDQAIERNGVPAPWFAVLHMLRRAPSGGLPMNVLARDLGMTSGGFTKLADRMARDGLIDRRGTSGDRRVVQATLTEAGREMAARLDVVHVDTLRETVSGVRDGGRLVAAGEVLAEIADAQHDTMAAPAPVEPGMVATQRDPALPERRGRGRARE